MASLLTSDALLITCFVLFLSSRVFGESYGDVPIYKMHEKCGKLMNEWMKLVPENVIEFESTTPNMDCQLKIYVPHYAGIWFRFIKMSFPNCNSRVDINEINVNGTAIVSGLCQKPEEIFKTGAYMFVIRFRSGATGYKASFKLFGTVYFSALADQCTVDKHVRCTNNQLCIHESLFCNRRENCLGDYDESECVYWVSDLRDILVSVSVLSVTATVSIIIAVKCYLWVLARRANQTIPI